MRLLPSFNLETIQNVLGVDFPDLSINRIRRIDNGWANVCVEINDEWIFRFPKDQ